MRTPSIAAVLTLFTLAASAVSAPGCAAPEGEGEEGVAGEDALTMGTKPWDDQAEAEWTKWVSEIGEARLAKRCIRLNDCMNDKTINKLKGATDANLNIFADCADVPLEMRAYFAVKTGRPFQYVREITGSQYSKDNKPVNYADARSAATVQALMTSVSQSVHSGHFRMRSNVEGSDTYPVDITRETVKPGTIFYDPNGHVLLVVRVDPDGTIRMIDGHPDNSLTTQIFGEKFAVGGSSQGGGFRRFRPYTFVGGTFTRAPNASLTSSKFGLAETQYGKGNAYYAWVRERLSNGVALDPIKEMTELSGQLCTDLQDRATSVKGAARVANGPLGAVAPNIYGASGEWEELSTPSRDARFKASFRGIKHLVEKFGAPQSQTVKTMGRIWSEATTTCKITYTNSAGGNVTLSLGQVEARLFDLSFDPYHCPEMRWGAHPSQAAEMATCRTDAAHMKRFDDERTQRNAIDREYGAPTPFGWGPAQPEDVNVTRYLQARGGL